MRIGIHSATVNIGAVDTVVAEVERTRSAGLASYWAPMLGGQDTLTALAVAGRAVADVELGTAVVPMPVRSPFALAQQVSTVQQVVGGRLTLGLGTSHASSARELFGVDWPPPLRAARAYLGELAEITGSGRIATAADQRTETLLGAVNPAMVALAVELADGIVMWSAAEATLTQVVRPALTERDASRPFRIVVSLPVCVTDAATETRTWIRRRYGVNDDLPSYAKVLEREGADGIAEMAVVGTARQVADRLDALADLGVTDFAAHVVGTTRDDVDRTWELLTEHATVATA